jgi:hypothetical protein
VRKGMKILKLPDDIYKKYVLYVKNNEYTQRDQAALKLTRNINLVKELAPKEYIERKWLTTTYEYGNLSVSIRLGKVVDIVNRSGWVEIPWMKTKEFKHLYTALTVSLGIEDNKFNRGKRKFSST